MKPIIDPATLTDEQREAILHEYQANLMYAKRGMKSCVPVVSTLEWLFGKEMFNQDEEKK